MTRNTIALLVLALMIGGHPASAQTPASPDSAAQVALGKTVFQGNGLCFSCHGKAGEGVLGPTTRLIGRALTHAKPTVEDLASLIKTGVDSAHSTSGQLMPPRGGSRISDAEVTAVARYVLDLRHAASPPPL